ncbi:MAG: hypothetical protein ACXAC5_17665 [Promethearchaeota archaeon]
MDFLGRILDQTYIAEIFYHMERTGATPMTGSGLDGELFNKG